MYSCCALCGSGDSAAVVRKITLLLVGLDNAGKTTIAKALVGEPLDTVAPTVGFSAFSLKHRKYQVSIYDLGGGPRIRGIWHNYFADVHGLIYVVDASDTARLEESRKILSGLLQHKQLAGKPMLLLANKQDCENALDEIEIVERLELEALVNQQKCPTRVETCSACPPVPSQRGWIEVCSKRRRGKGRGRRRIGGDPGVKQGFRWLVATVVGDMDQIGQRVERDTAEARAKQEEEKKARALRVKASREERGEEEVEAGDDRVGFRPIEEVTSDLERREREDAAHNGGAGHQAEAHLNGHAATPTIKQFELEDSKPKKKNLLKKLNKTAPMVDPNEESPKKFLPPISLAGSIAAPWIKSPLGSGEGAERSSSQQSRHSGLVTHNWGLAEDLEVVEAATPKKA